MSRYGCLYFISLLFDTTSVLKGVNIYFIFLITLLIIFINRENKKNPLGDEELASELCMQGFKIARRTVAKYREQLKIPVSRLRKTL